MRVAMLPLSLARVPLAQWMEPSLQRVRSWCASDVVRQAEFPSEPHAAKLVRRFVTGSLTHWGIGRWLCVDDALLAAGELFANSVTHVGPDGGPVLVVMRWRAGVLRVEIHDGSAVLPITKMPTAQEESGRGLDMVAQLADDWGAVLKGKGGKYVYAEFRLRRCEADAW